MADQVSARLSSARVPVLAGREAVTEPRAPATGERVIVPDVALPKVTEPRVPEDPRERAPTERVAEESTLAVVVLVVWTMALVAPPVTAWGKAMVDEEAEQPTLPELL